MAEFDALSLLCTSVLQDLKGTSCTWDAMSSRGLKLAAQLNNTAVCLSNFVDCLQTLSDAANSLKGASKDIGAALTRFCLRQRTLQSDLRALATCISESFSSNLERRSTEWKQQVAELERRQHRITKKKRSKKDKAGELLVEQKAFSTDLLINQRQVFIAFTNTLLPVVKSQIHMLEEGLHIKEIYEQVEMDIIHTDAAMVVKETLEDASGNGDSWKKRLPSPSRSTTSSKASSRNHIYAVSQSANLPISLPSTSSFVHNWVENSGDQSKMAAKPQLSSCHQRSLPIGNGNFPSSKPPFPLRDDNEHYSSLMPGGLSISNQDVSAHSRMSGPPHDSSRVIDDTISQLNEELSSFYGIQSNDPQGTVRSHVSVNSHGSRASQAGIRQRHPSFRIPPPPPERRNSSITAATPNTPSVVDLRTRISFVPNAESTDPLNSATPRLNDNLSSSESSLPWPPQLINSTQNDEIYYTK